MQIILFSLIGLVFIFLEIQQKILKNIKTIKSNRKSIKYIRYYREKIDDYSPLIYAKLLNKKITNSDVIVSMILFLEEKNIIDRDNQNNIIIKNNSNLKQHEKFFIEKIRFIFSDLYHNTKTKYTEDCTVFDRLEQLLYADMLQEGLIDLKKQKSSLINFIKGKNFVYIMDILPLFYDIIAIIFLGNAAQHNVHNNVFNIIFWSTTFVIILINVINILFNLNTNTLKTEKGHIYTEKIKAQKRFLKTYTLISTKSIEDKIIWESYIRNAILLNMKGKLDENSVAYYIAILDKYSYIGLEKSNFNFVILFIFLISPWVFLFIVGNSIMKTILCAFIIIPLIYFYLINKANKSID